MRPRARERTEHFSVSSLSQDIPSTKNNIAMKTSPPDKAGEYADDHAAISRELRTFPWCMYKRYKCNEEDKIFKRIKTFRKLSCVKFSTLSDIFLDSSIIITCILYSFRKGNARDIFYIGYWHRLSHRRSYRSPQKVLDCC